jgi:hypothetical protein
MRVLASKAGIEAPANVQERHTGFCETRKILARRNSGHRTAQHRVLTVDAGDLARVFGRPRVRFPGCVSRTCHHRLRRKAVLNEMFVDRVPMSQGWAVGVKRDRPGNNVKSFLEQGQVNGGVAWDEVGSENPRFTFRRSVRDNNRDGAVDTGEFERESVVTIGEPGSATRDPGALRGEFAVEVLDAVKSGLRDATTQVVRRDLIGRLNAPLDEICDGFWIAQAVRVMADAVL